VAANAGGSLESTSAFRGNRTLSYCGPMTAVGRYVKLNIVKRVFSLAVAEI